MSGGANATAITRVFTDRGVAAGTVYGPDLTARVVTARDLADIKAFQVAHGETER